ncbi:pyruvate decarboxylase [Fusarium albosuccineum]|uniref:Pyruvate decarboxylase n=1 Tax=Fusarium albosuccineum TaxID=1237068 RepID=A0A8H4LB90_9HYPO|nr:pyruvate decarboxylase [Fusarium albosuccineum]
MPSSIKLAEYLFTRLRQLGVESIHGVPGDYNLSLLDYVQPAGLRWVGNANELNAAYAADGYARIKGIGAVVTTFGVGELSAVNAIAGAYTEYAPVVHIVGIPSRVSEEKRLLIHHTFNDGEYRRFAAMHAHVTVAQECLRDPKTSADQIDEVLKQCLLYSRPVYLEVPVDMVAKPLPADRLQTPISLPEGEPDEAQDEVLHNILDKIYSAKQPVIIVDGETRPLGIRDSVQALIKSTKWPTWTTGFGKSLTEENLPNFHGIYKGNFDDPKTHAFIQEADLVLFFGPHLSFTNTYGDSAIPKEGASILFTPKGIQIGKQTYHDVSCKYVTSRLVNDLDSARIASYDPYPQLPRDSLLQISEKPPSEKLTQDGLWRILANLIQPGDIVLGETGTSGYGVKEMPLPLHTRLFTPVTWLSIGYMLPGAQGAALAQQELLESSNYHGLSTAKTILFIGDGSFQMTAQEIATMVRHKLNVVIFLINNDGYTIERALHGKNQEYNDVTPWRYLEAPSFFGAKKGTYTGSAKTWQELKEVLEHEGLNNDTELRMVEIFLEREDCPKGPLSWFMDKQK